MAPLTPRVAQGLAPALLTVSQAVAAAPVRHVALTWSQDDPACIGEADLTSAVERTLGRSVFHSDAPPFAKVTGAVGKAALAGFEARIALWDKDGRKLAERTLTTPGECARLDESVAVVVTLMIDGVEEVPTTLQIAAAPPRAGEKALTTLQIAAAPPRPGVPLAVPPPPDLRPAPIVLTFGVGAGLSSSLLPGVAASFGVRGELAARGFVPVALTLRVHPASSTMVAGAGGRFSAWTAELAACPGWSSRRVRIGGCAGLEGGALAGTYINLAEGESHVRPLLLATLVPFAAVRLGGPFWARLSAGAWFPLLRERWGYLDARGAFEEVFRPAPVVPAATLTLEAQAGS
jgi:hypothetical protein